ncbi:uncharacterized protein Tco025E_06418, partial [Trypanosoma conorhini]
MTSTVNAAVLKYLEEHHPDVARAFQREASISNRRRRPNGITVEALLASQHAGVKRPRDELLSEDEELVQNKSRTARKAAVPYSSDDDDDEPVRKPAPKANASSAVKPAANKAAVLESSDDDDDEPVRKPAPKANASSAVKPAANKAAVLESSTTTDEPVRKPALKANASSAMKP